MTDELYKCEPIANDLSEGSILAVKSEYRPSVHFERLETKPVKVWLESKMESVQLKLKEIGRETAILKLNRTKNDVVQVGYALQESVVRDQHSMTLSGAHMRSSALIIHQRDMIFICILKVLPVLHSCCLF